MFPERIPVTENGRAGDAYFPAAAASMAGLLLLRAFAASRESHWATIKIDAGGGVGEQRGPGHPALDAFDLPMAARRSMLSGGTVPSPVGPTLSR